MNNPMRLVLAAIFIIGTVVSPVCAEGGGLLLPKPGTLVPVSRPFNPPILKGIKIHPDQPLSFDFLLERGDRTKNVTPSDTMDEAGLRQASERMVKYFLAALTVPKQDLWVNLSPYEQQRIVPEAFGKTDMGRDLLAQDYLLKQITATLMYPENEIGKKFWREVYTAAAQRFGTINIPVNTFNKVWIVPERAVIYENAKAGTAYVVEGRLKVMLEQDYLALKNNQRVRPQDGTAAMASGIIRDIVLPQLTKDVNTGSNFAKLRQIYHALILATWYKKKIKDSLLNVQYSNRNKVAGVTIDDPQDKERIYQRYLEAFKKGVYNLIKEEVDPATRQPIPRKYFSGGFSMEAVDDILEPAPRVDYAAAASGEEQVLEVDLAMMAPEVPWTAEDATRFNGRSKIDFHTLMKAVGGIGRPKEMRIIDIPATRTPTFNLDYKKHFVDLKGVQSLQETVEMLTASDHVAYVYKKNSSAQSQEVFFIEKDEPSGDLILTALADTAAAQMLTGLLVQHDISGQQEGSVVRFRLKSRFMGDQVRAREVLKPLFKLFQGYDAYIPGFLESLEPFIQPEGRAFESRHTVAIDQSTGQLNAQASGILTFSRWGTSGYFTANKEGEFRAGSTFQPFYRTGVVAWNRKRAFETYVRRLVVEQAKGASTWLKERGIVTKDGLFKIELDLMWLPAQGEGEFPIPLIIEGRVISELNLESQPSVPHVSGPLPNGHPDTAMTAPAPPEDNRGSIQKDNLGGIDLSRDTPVQVNNDLNRSITIKMDRAMLQQLTAASGLKPQRISIQPLADLKAFLEAP